MAWLAQVRRKSSEWDQMVVGKQQRQRYSTSKPTKTFAQQEMVEHRRQWLTMTNEKIKDMTSKQVKVFAQQEAVEH